MSKIPLCNPNNGKFLLRTLASYNKLLDRVACLDNLRKIILKRLKSMPKFNSVQLMVTDEIKSEYPLDCRKPLYLLKKIWSEINTKKN